MQVVLLLLLPKDRIAGDCEFRRCTGSGIFVLLLPFELCFYLSFVHARLTCARYLTCTFYATFDKMLCYESLQE